MQARHHDLKFWERLFKNESFAFFDEFFSDCQNHCQVDCAFSAFVELALAISLVCLKCERAQLLTPVLPPHYLNCAATARAAVPVTPAPLSLTMFRPFYSFQFVFYTQHTVLQKLQ